MDNLERQVDLEQKLAITNYKLYQDEIAKFEALEEFDMGLQKRIGDLTATVQRLTRRAEQDEMRIDELVRNSKTCDSLLDNFRSFTSGLVAQAEYNYRSTAWWASQTPTRKVEWAFAPLPSDFFRRTWHDNLQGQEVWRWLPGPPGYDNTLKEASGHLAPVVAWPAWAHRFYDPDPPDPKWAHSGIVANYMTGEFPYAWKNSEAQAGIYTFFQRLQPLVDALVLVHTTPSDHPDVSLVSGASLVVDDPASDFVLLSGVEPLSRSVTPTCGL